MRPQLFCESELLAAYRTVSGNGIDYRLVACRALFDVFASAHAAEFFLFKKYYKITALRTNFISILNNLMFRFYFLLNCVHSFYRNYTAEPVFDLPYFPPELIG